MDGSTLLNEHDPDVSVRNPVEVQGSVAPPPSAVILGVPSNLSSSASDPADSSDIQHSAFSTQHSSSPFPHPPSLETAVPGVVKAEFCPTDILPAGGWHRLNFREIWHYREVLYFLTWRDVKVRYKQTALGAGWAVLQPVLMMIVFTIFFGKMARVRSGDIPYPIFAFAGLLPWMFFSTAIANAGNSIVNSERLITKIYFPRLAIPLASVAAVVVDFLVASAVLVVLMLWYSLRGAPIHIGPGLLLAPVIFALIALAAIGVGTLLAALNVTYRDFRYVIPFLVQLWLFATPTVYMQPFSDPGVKMQIALLANPLAGLVGAFRSSVLGTPIPWNHLAIAAALSFGLFLTGCLYFRKVEDGFADVI